MSQLGALRVLLICPSTGLRTQVTDAFDSLQEVTLSHTIPAYPSGSELARALRTYSPQLALLSFEKPETAVAVMRFLESEARGLPVIAIHETNDPNRMFEGMRAGAREFLTPPFQRDQLLDAITVIQSALRKAPLSYSATDHIYSFLPAKPGVGATTIALNTSAAFARRQGMKVLLADLDLTCGMIRFLLKLPQELSIVDALARATEMDSSLWPQLITKREGVDVLHSGVVNPQAHLEPLQVQGLIDFARSSYNALFFDMSGNFERHSLYVIQESKRVFIVCNPEPASVFLGRQKIEFLRSMGVGPRIAAVINRADQALALPLADVERDLGVPVITTFPDDTFTVHRAIKGGRSLFGDPKQKNSALASQYADFVKTLVDSGHPDGSLAGIAQNRDRAAILA